MWIALRFLRFLGQRRCFSGKIQELPTWKDSSLAAIAPEAVPAVGVTVSAPLKWLTVRFFFLNFLNLFLFIYFLLFFVELPYKSDGTLRSDIPVGFPIYECNSSCKCSIDCLNRVTQRPGKSNLLVCFSIFAFVDFGTPLFIFFIFFYISFWITAA